MLLGDMVVGELLDMPISLRAPQQDNLLLLSIPIPMVFSYLCLSCRWINKSCMALSPPTHPWVAELVLLKLPMPGGRDYKGGTWL